MSTLETDLIQAATGTNTAIKIKGKGSGVVKIGDGELAFPDADGSANQIIKTDGSGTLSFIAQPGGGATALLARATFTDTSSGVSFTGFDSSTYDAYQFIFYITDTSSADRVIRVQTSTDGGSSYDSGGSDYIYTVLEKGGTTTATTDYIAIQPNHRSTGVATEPICFTAFLIRPDTTDKTVLFWAGGMYATGISPTFSNMIGAGSRDTAADVDGIKFYPNSGTVSGSYQAIGWKSS
tara:strand:- start:640 stop:1350 length:711 start_codon:yes stop_codon:yes gene_type:complete